MRFNTYSIGFSSTHAEASNFQMSDGMATVDLTIHGEPITELSVLDLGELIGFLNLTIDQLILRAALESDLQEERDNE